MSFKTLLNKTCIIRRLTAGAPDNLNQPTMTEADLATNVPCALMPQKTSNREVFVDKQVVISTHVLFLEKRDITEKDKVVVDTVTYDILTVREPAGRDHHLELDLMRVKA